MRTWRQTYAMVALLALVALVLTWRTGYDAGKGSHPTDIPVERTIPSEPSCTLYEDGSTYCNSSGADGSACIIPEWGCL